VPSVIVLHVPQPDVRFSVAQMNAQQKVPIDYWRGPDRRPERRPVITTGATRHPERNREWSTGPQPKPTGTRPAAQRQATLRQEGSLMPTVTVGQENNADIEIHYEDHGAGQPVVLIHGYPLSGRAWDKQVPVLLEAGHRVITYDRRGFGQSSQPVIGYDYDTFAADLNTLLEHLDLHDAVLAGHSMGTGEVTRYLGRYGSARVAKGVLISPIPPYLLQADDNPDGVPPSLFDGFAQAARADTPAWMKGFLDNFYNIDTLRGTRVSDQAYQASWNLAVTASATAAVACIGTWTTDFRDDLPKIDVPMLVIHGDADQVLPLDKTGKRLPGLIKDVHLVVVEGGPHAIAWTHADQVNTALLDFLRS
jgi:non-heme chloroperoxidase